MESSGRYFQSGLNRERSCSEVYRTLIQREQEPNPDELYQLALAAYLTGRESESIELFSRTHHQFLENQKIKLAVRCAFQIGLLLMLRGERARENGCFSRAKRQIEVHRIEGDENGLLLIPVTLGALGSGNALYRINFYGVP